MPYKKVKDLKDDSVITMNYVMSSGLLHSEGVKKAIANKFKGTIVPAE